MERIEADYKQQRGTGHFEQIDIGGTIVNISRFLKDLRHLDFERLVFFCVENGALYEISHFDGNQFSSGFLPENAISSLTLAKMRNINKNQINIYVCHNHPFSYKAWPSSTDLQECYTLLYSIIQKMNSIDCLTKIRMVDFAIVTDFDYWSSEQMLLK